MIPRLSFLGAPMLPPTAFSAGLAGELTTPTKPQKLHKSVTPDKLVKCAVDVPVDDPAADVSVDDQGWPISVAHICADDVPDGVPAADSSVDDASVGVSVDDQGWPTIFGNFLHVDAKEEPTKQHERHHDNEHMPAIRPINPNVRARKLHNNGVAKARQASGVEPTVITNKVRKQKTSNQERVLEI